MALDTSSKRRSSVGILSPWQVAPPSPTDSPGVIDAYDREQIAGTYSGILAAAPGHTRGHDAAQYGSGLAGRTHGPRRCTDCDPDCADSGRTLATAQPWAPCTAPAFRAGARWRAEVTQCRN